MITDPLVMFANGTLPVKTSTTSIANAKTSPNFDAVICLESVFLGGSMISGASHRGDPAVPGVAAIVKVGFEMMGVRP